MSWTTLGALADVLPHATTRCGIAFRHLWTLTEQVFEHHADTPQKTAAGLLSCRVAQSSSCSAQSGRNIDGAADRSPHVDRGHSLGERFVNGPSAEFGDHEVVREGVGIRGAELLAHPLPEVGQPHWCSMPSHLHVAQMPHGG